MTTSTYRIPGWEGSVGPTHGYGKLHVYARDTNSGAGNCVCGLPLGDWRHVQAAPGVPIPPNLRPIGATPFACSVCGMVSHHPEDKRHRYCGNCHDWTSDLYPNEAEAELMASTIVLPDAAFDRLLADLDAPVRPSKLRDLLERDPAGVIRAVSEHAVQAAREALVAARGAGQRLPRETIELALAGSSLAGGWGLRWRDLGSTVHRGRIASSYDEVHEPITLIVSACGLTAPWDHPVPYIVPSVSNPTWPEPECGFCLLGDESVPKDADGAPMGV